ncbi:1 TM domain-containing transmembrane protein [Acrasis kona]|uniref:1 TM domain-containing transmembrane protein n=1 Tax=Acrasis kona TaxID=1008807 RepID=A0AAW2ZCZ0_9EUKA
MKEDEMELTTSQTRVQNDTKPINQTSSKDNELVQLMTNVAGILVDREDEELSQHIREISEEKSNVGRILVNITTINEPEEEINTSQSHSNLPLINHSAIRILTFPSLNETNTCLLSEKEFYTSMLTCDINNNTLDTLMSPRTMYRNVIETSTFVGPINPKSDIKSEHQTETHRKNPSASGNVLKSMLLKIREQDAKQEALVQLIQSFESRYSSAFRDIQKVLEKNSDEHNTLARALSSMDDTNQLALNQLRADLNSEVSQLRYNVHYTCDLIKRSVNATINRVESQIESRLNDLYYIFILGFIFVIIFISLFFVLCSSDPHHHGDIRSGHSRFHKPHPQSDSDSDTDDGYVVHQVQAPLVSMVNIKSPRNISLFRHLGNYFSKITSESTSPTEGGHKEPVEQEEELLVPLRRARSMSLVELATQIHSPMDVSGDVAIDQVMEQNKSVKQQNRKSIERSGNQNKKSRRKKK